VQYVSSLCVILYECDTWSPTLREEQRLRVVPKREEVRGNRTELHNEELHDLCSSLNIIQVIKPWRMRGVGHVACVREKGDAHNFCAEI
jgi:hypothetical protein